MTLALRNNRGRQPVHVEGEIVHPAQIDVGRDGAFLQDVEQVLGLRFDQDTRAERIKLLRFGARYPAVLVGAGLGVDDFVHDILPRAGGHL